MHLAVAILRVSKGHDYSQVLGEDVPISIFQLPKTIPSNDSSADLNTHDKSNIHGSCDSLSRNVSQGKLCSCCYEIEQDTWNEVGKTITTQSKFHFNIEDFRTFTTHKKPDN